MITDFRLKVFRAVAERLSFTRAADELFIAAVTRGIERPGRRSCLVEIRMRGADWGAMGVFAGFLVFTMLAKGAG